MKHVALGLFGVVALPLLAAFVYTGWWGWTVKIPSENGFVVLWDFLGATVSVAGGGFWIVYILYRFGHGMSER